MNNSSLRREEILDRYHQHTQICGSCRQALKRDLPLVMLGLTGLGIGLGLKFWLEPKFYFVNYVHADR